jgi:hypothetical protein
MARYVILYYFAVVVDREDPGVENGVGRGKRLIGQAHTRQQNAVGYLPITYKERPFSPLTLWPLTVSVYIFA